MSSNMLSLSGEADVAWALTWRFLPDIVVAKADWWALVVCGVMLLNKLDNGDTRWHFLRRENNNKTLLYYVVC